jgi:hypothetical protein
MVLLDARHFHRYDQCFLGLVDVSVREKDPGWKRRLIFLRKFSLLLHFQDKELFVRLHCNQRARSRRDAPINEVGV